MERKEGNEWGSCLVAWEKVMRPIDLGGLGIHNLEIMGGCSKCAGCGLRRPDRTGRGLVLRCRFILIRWPCLQFQLSPLLATGGILYYGLIDGCMVAAWRTLHQMF